MRICMLYTDRPGLLLDISQVLVNWGSNIVSVEVDKGAIYLECQLASEDQKTQVMRELQQVDGISKVSEVFYMPSKERAEQFEAVLTSVQDGVLAVNKLGILKQCIEAAANILKLQEDNLEQPLLPGLADSLLISRTIGEGHSFRNREVFIESIGRYCVVSTRPLRNGTNEVAGAVVTLCNSKGGGESIQKVSAFTPVTFMDISCASSAMEKVLEQARRYAGSSSTVLIRGEAGTGKKFFATALHSASPRVGMPFLSVNCATLQDTLLERKLFGYEEADFIGAAKAGAPGLFELANGGTLFMDEIGELSVHLQAKLLRVLQEKRVCRLGSSREVPVDIRLIAATQRDLADMMKHRLFREDLYYRLNVLPLFLPPLRKRAEDIPFLAEYFANRFAAKLDTPARRFSPEAMEKLQTYSWPGNICELENIIEWAVKLGDSQEIQPEHIHIDTQSLSVRPGSDTIKPSGCYC